MSDKAIGYMGLSLLAFCKYDGGGLKEGDGQRGEWRREGVYCRGVYFHGGVVKLF